MAKKRKRGECINRPGRPKNTADSPVSIKHMMVLDEWFRNGFDKTKACRHVGYAHPNQQATAIFKLLNVQAEIKRRQARMRAKVEVDEDWVVERLKLLANANIGQIIQKIKENGNDLSCLTEEESYIISEFTEETVWEGYGKDKTEVRKLRPGFESRLRALENLMRFLGMNDDRLRVTDDRDLEERLLAGRDRAAKKKDGKETVH